MEQFFYIGQWLFFGYFVLFSGGYLLLSFVALFSISKYIGEHSIDDMQGVATNIMPPISLLVPAHNEASTITNSIHALLQLNYSEYEIIVINDGSSDSTLEEIVNAFELIPFPEAYRQRLTTQPINEVYRSKKYSKLKLIDKKNGGKADAINVGINVAMYPLFCTVDADSILQSNSLQRIAQPFINDSRTVASGGTVRLVNGCSVKRGFMYKVGLPKNIIALFQIVEYLRSFLFGRLGWSSMNALLIISGAFGLFHKETVISVGGYRTDTIGEDMELILRLHRLLRKRKQEYKIVFVPDPICWTEAPENIRELSRQRIRWQRGLSESLFKNISLLFNPQAGAVGFLSFPFMLIFEWFGPLIEVVSYVVITVGFVTNNISVNVFIALIGVAMGFGMLLSAVVLLLEEIYFHTYQKKSDIARLFLAVIFENLGYRQVNALWRFIGLTQWALNLDAKWGEMNRGADWQKEKNE